MTWQRSLTVGWLACLAAATCVRCHVWISDAALWADALRVAPEKPRVVMNDGRTHELAGDTAYAEAAYRKTIWLSWDERRSAYVRRFSLAAAETNLAHLAMKEGRMAAAMFILDTTLEQWPEFPYAHYNRGAILWLYGACDDAMVEYAKAMTGDPSLPPPGGSCHPAAAQ